MAYKVILDAGHGGRESGPAYEGRTEKDDDLNLTLAIGEILSNNGVEVIYTRTEDEYITPPHRANMANDSGADFFVSIHRNVSGVANTRSGVITLVESLHDPQMELAVNINEELEKVGFENLGVIANPDYIVLSKTVMPAVLVEVGFINNDKDNLIFDTKLIEIAQSIADGILYTLNDTYDGRSTLYRVQVGIFRQLNNATDLLDQLHQEGLPAYLVNEEGYYKVQVGAYDLLENA
ncbi:MAG TPA: N-acetylmuramoyl-L-alanine amidase, partial [Candidatus Merdenecus merdavium]|nr:N-acetylmuramoyl-L-alanine amidase [Candidatus Merdenecus merdavium]